MTFQAQIGQTIIKAEQPATSGRFFATVNEACGKAGFCYDAMNLAKKVAQACGEVGLAKRLEGYTQATAVPRLPASVYTLYTTVQNAKKEPMTFSAAVKLFHDACETAAMSLFTTAFVNPSNARAVNAGVIFNATSDVADVATQGMNYNQSRQLLKGAEQVDLSREVETGLKEMQKHSLIKLAKAVTASVAGFFTCYALLTGTALVGPGVALAVGLASSVFAIAATFSKSYFADYFASATVVPVKMA